MSFSGSNKIATATPDWQAPINAGGGGIGGVYSVHPGNIDITELVNPTTQDVDTFNHSPVIFQSSDGVVHVAHTRHNFSEDFPGQDIQYFSQSGGTWSSQSLVFPATTANLDFGAALPADWTFGLPAKFVEDNGRIYLIVDVHKRTPGWGEPPRLGVALLAVEISSGVGGAPALIYPQTYTPYDGFDDYEYSPALAKRLLPEVMRAGSVPWVWSLSDDLPRVLPYLNDRYFTTQSSIQLGNGTWICYARYQSDAGDSLDDWLWYSTSSNGDNWSEWQQSNLPNSPTKAEFGRLTNGVYVTVGNSQNSARQPLHIGYSADGLTWKTGDVYELTRETVSTSNGVFRGGGKGGGASYASWIELDNGNIAITYSQRKERIYFMEITPTALS